MRHLPLFVLFTAGPILAAGSGRQTLPLFFTANHGQAPAAVRYVAQGPELTAYFSANEVLFRLGERTLQMRLEGSAATRVEGIDRLPGQVNFLTGPQSTWQTGQSIYGGVAYRNLYSGIDMVYNGSVRNLKSEFHVAPGADPSAIRVRYLGASNVRIDAAGALVIRLGNREFRGRRAGDLPGARRHDAPGERPLRTLAGWWGELRARRVRRLPAARHRPGCVQHAARRRQFRFRDRDGGRRRGLGVSHRLHRVARFSGGQSRAERCGRQQRYLRG